MDLLVHEHYRVLHVILNRPDKRNALTAGMCSGIIEAVTSAQDRKDVGAILISAVGHVFCSGMDLDEAAGLSHEELGDIHENLFSIGVNSLKPIVVSVTGAALGGGLGLVAQGHVVMAAEGSVFGMPEIKIGLWPFLVYRAVEAALGFSRTIELSLTGRVIHAEDALQWGLVQHVCPPAETSDRAKGMAREIAKASPAAIESGMRYYRDSRGKSWKEAGQLARALRLELMESEDFKEGCEAFKQKREPHWPSMPQEFYAERHRG
jgi:enoyl-CoA hydratase/carnithine racemase